MLDSIYNRNVEGLPARVENRPQHCDVAIVGGGLTGVTAALHLAEHGYDVVLLEADTIGSGGSGRNGGHLCQGWSNDFYHISKQLSQQDADLAWNAGMEAVDLVVDRINKHHIKCDLRFGYLHAAIHRRQMNELLTMNQEWSQRGYNQFTELTDPAAMAEQINSSAYIGGLFDSGSGQIQPLKYLIGLAIAAQAAGVKIFEKSPVTKIDRNEKKTLHFENAPCLSAAKVLLCGNAYLANVGLPQMTNRLAHVTSSVLATQPLSENMIKHILPNRATVADCNTALNYYRIDAENRMIFGGRASYTNVNLGNVEADLHRRMCAIFPILSKIESDCTWSGRIGITVNRIPHFGRTEDDIYFVQGFSGHGVALTGLAGSILAEAIMGDAERFDVMQSLRQMPFPGGVLRTPALALGMAWHKLRDKFQI